MLNRWKSMLVVFLIVLGFSMQNALAATVLKFSLEDMSRKAQTIFVGKCISAWSQWDEEHAEIYTYIVFSVQEKIKGDFEADRITVRQLGGSVGGARSTVPGTPTFKPVEEVVLFLTAEDKEGYPWVVGLSQGCFSIKTDVTLRRKIVVSKSGGLSLWDRATGRVSVEEGKTVPLEDFIKRIKDALGDARHKTLGYRSDR